MPKRFSKDKRPKDVNQFAHRLVQLSTAEPQPQEAIITPLPLNTSEVSRVMAEMGRRGGQIGGKRRLTTMTSEQRRKLAQKAAKARWKKTKKL
jgi:hypothetical protein